MLHVFSKLSSRIIECFVFAYIISPRRGSDQSYSVGTSGACSLNASSLVVASAGAPQRYMRGLPVETRFGNPGSKLWATDA